MDPNWNMSLPNYPRLSRWDFLPSKAKTRASNIFLLKKKTKRNTEILIDSERSWLNSFKGYDV